MLKKSRTIVIIFSALLIVLQIVCTIVLFNAETLTELITCASLICSTVIILVTIITAAIILTNCEKNKSKNEKEKIDAIKMINVITRLNAYKATNDSLASIEKNVNIINENVDNILKEIKNK